MAITSINANPVSVSSDGAQARAPSPPSGTTVDIPQVANAAAAARSPTPEQLNQAVKRINDAFAKQGQNLYASIEKDETTGINVVKFQDRSTREVVRQYPSREILAIAEAFDKSLGTKGRLLNVNA